MSIEVRKADEFARLAKQLKEAGDKGLQKELSRAISQATKPIIKAARQSALATLPRRGGLARKVAGSRFTTSKRTSSRAAGIRIQARNPYGLGQLDKGVAHHPVFGNRDVWVRQPVTPGWWTKPADAAAPQVRQEIVQAMERVAKQINHGI